MRTISLAIAVALTALVAVEAQAPPAPPPDARAMSPTLEDVPYPYPVSFLPLTVAGRHVRMASMDVRPPGPANGTVVLLAPLDDVYRPVLRLDYAVIHQSIRGTFPAA